MINPSYCGLNKRSICQHFFLDCSGKKCTLLARRYLELDISARSVSRTKFIVLLVPT